MKEKIFILTISLLILITFFSGCLQEIADNFKDYEYTTTMFTLYDLRNETFLRLQAIDDDVCSKCEEKT